MPRMLPAEIYDRCPSPGEREVFCRLRDSPDIGDWVVLHSLDLAQHVRNVSGEADFVILVPGLGMLCLEVKACSRLRRDDRGWWYGKEPKPDVRGPFRQASEAMHTIRQRIAKARPDLSDIVCWSAVIFPCLNFDERSPEWHEWQVIDSRRLRSGILPDLLRGVLIRARSHLQQKGAAWFKGSGQRPTTGQVNELADMLRPSFELFASPKARAQDLDTQLKRYTEEQYRALDSMIANPRVLYLGPAGTGKTLLAIEAARRAAAAGRRVLFLCFNRHLGQWLTDQMGMLKPQVKVSTLHRYMLDACRITAPAAPTTEFWEVELPARALGMLLERGGGMAAYEELIVDEAQDVILPDYLDVLDVSLLGGLSTGRWRFFGDFEKQALYADASINPLSDLKQRVSGFTEYGLRENCRNPPRIACLAHLLGRLVPDYSRILRPDNGVEPEILYYQDADHQRRLVADQIEILYKEGIRCHEIAVLSSRSSQNSVVPSLANDRWRFRPWADRTNQDVGYCSIHAFKGLEARAVILTDIDELGPPGESDLFYTGVTRAVERLTILVSRNARASVVSALLNRQNGQNK